MDLVFLGTGSGMPTSTRALPSIAIRWGNEILILDCGEGMQYRYLRTGFGVNKEMKILISHLHGDHYFGLFGFLQTLALSGRSRDLLVIGPEGIAEIIDAILKRSGVSSEAHSERGYRLLIKELKSEVEVLDFSKYRIKAVRVEHSITSYAFAIEERELPGTFHPEKARALGIPIRYWKVLQSGQSVVLPDGRVIHPHDVCDEPRRGLKLVYSGDTRPCEELINLAKGADILIHESTFMDKDKDKAIESMHSTAREAAWVAKEAEVRSLILFHISPRYSEQEELLLKEAEDVFSNVYLAKDMDWIEIDHE